MRKNNRRMAAVLSFVLVLGLCMSLFSGCDGTKPAGLERMDTDGQKFLLITLDADDLTEAQVWARRLEQNQETGEYTVTQTYTPTQTADGNTYGLLVEEAGIYEVGADCQGYFPVSHIVIVEDQQVYVLELSPLPESGETEPATESGTPEETAGT